jgi:hypothetical protein
LYQICGVGRLACTLIESDPLVAVLPFSSVAFTVKVKVPAAEGVPEISPPELSAVPVGRDPEASV